MSVRNGLEQLPIDVIERIVSYLTVGDLSKCCAISKSWRIIFSDDIFWKNHCISELSNYLENVASLVTPQFTIPKVEKSNLTPVKGWRLRFLREQHLWKNWKLGRFTREIIEFDCDDTMSYNIKVECVSNDFVFLHYTFETEIYDVSKKPQVLFNVPFRLVEMWENNLYKVVNNKLIVVQCNVVQVFDIDLVLKSWSFDRAFFFDKPEEFSSKITAETDIDEMFQESSSHIGDSVERVIGGDYLVGIVTEKGALNNPVMHVWNWKTGKKLKEENCVKYFGNKPKNMSLETSETPTEEIVVFSQNRHKRRFVVYSLTNFKFLTCNEVENENSLMFGRHLVTFSGSDVKFFKLNNEATSVTSCNVCFQIERIDCWHAINNKVLIANRNEVILLNPVNSVVEQKLALDFELGDFKIVQNKFVILQDRHEHAKEVWEGGKELKKLFCFPPNNEIYRATNNACTKVVLEQANKLIVLNFW